VLGLGVLFLTIFTTRQSAGNGTGGVRVLFGSILGLSQRDALVSVALAAGVALLVLASVRPLLFSTLDAAVAQARGVPVRLLGLAFLALLGVVAAQATQTVGALLLLGLLAAPAGAAARLTANPYRGLALAPALGLASVWGGLALTYVVPTVPPSSAIVGVATAVYLAALLASARPRRRRRLFVEMS
jgi:zinc/manganese transport system permease protein